MSLTSPKFLPAPAAQWIRGKREGLEASSRRCAFTRCCVGDGDLGAMLSLCFLFPSAFPTVYLCVAKTFALTIHSYTLDVFPVLF